ncbi:unnamed protein product [Prorocentrum cordatum]|uniref:Uncharacterized protein n=1 Tax=Prorocentrum cordatum TaxID=2364126 RepID=A0ABN9VLW2_9DINO|nr:unnamed protein product [Polarella glacialis]
MGACSDGIRRVEFPQKVEQHAGDISEEKWRSKWGQGGVQGCWDRQDCTSYHDSYNTSEESKERGATMGHSLAAGDFVDIYSPTVKGWNDSLAAADVSGVNYAGEVKAKGSKEMGSPHLHTGAEFFLELAKSDQISGETKDILAQFAELIEVMNKEDVANILSYFRVKKACAGPGQTQKWNIHIMFNPLSPSPWTQKLTAEANALRIGSEKTDIEIGTFGVQDLRQATCRALKVLQAQQIFGAPPPSALERQLQVRCAGARGIAMTARGAKVLLAVLGAERNLLRLRCGLGVSFSASSQGFGSCSESPGCAVRLAGGGVQLSPKIFTDIVRRFSRLTCFSPRLPAGTIGCFARLSCFIPASCGAPQRHCDELPSTTLSSFISGTPCRAASTALRFSGVAGAAINDELRLFYVDALQEAGLGPAASGHSPAGASGLAAGRQGSKSCTSRVAGASEVREARADSDLLEGWRRAVRSVHGDCVARAGREACGCCRAPRDAAKREAMLRLAAADADRGGARCPGKMRVAALESVVGQARPPEEARLRCRTSGFRRGAARGPSGVWTSYLASLASITSGIDALHGVADVEDQDAIGSGSSQKETLHSDIAHLTGTRADVPLEGVGRTHLLQSERGRKSRPEPVCVSRPNRWTRESWAPAAGGVEARPAAPEPAGTDPSVVALQLVLPHVPEGVLLRALQETGRDPDAALEALLAASASAAAGACPAPVEEEQPAQQPAARAATADRPGSPAPAAAAAERAAAADERRAAAASEQRPAPAPARQEDRPQAPAWQPMLRAAGAPGAKKSLYDLQTDRLKAALGPSPAASTAGAGAPPSQDFHKGGGKGRVGGS